MTTLWFGVMLRLRWPLLLVADAQAFRDWLRR